MATPRPLSVGIDIQGPEAVIAVELSRDGGVRAERVPLAAASWPV